MAVKKRLPEMDILRGMAILMVLLYHSIIVFPVNLHEIQWCSALHTFLWVVQMPLFFLVSGFCYTGPVGYGNYLHKKCMRILIPHIVFSLLDILPRIVPNPLVNEQMEWQEALTDFVVYGGSDWFLWTLFVIAALFPLVQKLLQRGRMGRTAVFAFAVILFAFKEDMPDELLLNMVSQYFLYYTVGWLLRGRWDGFAGQNQQRTWKSGRRGKKMDGDGSLSAWMPVLAFAGMLLFFAGFLYRDRNRYLELACVLCSSLLFYWVSCRLVGFGTGTVVSRIRRFLTECGTWSLQMYLLDAYALVLTRTLVVSVLGIQSPVFVVIGNFLPDTLIVFGISKYILTKVKVFRILCGIPEKKTNAI